MDKELKSKLKDAKKFYQKGEYDECQKLTQEILTEDSKSYQALVLKAACCDQLECEDEAADCFFHAINVDPGSMLAWQGLLQLCTKNLDRFYQTAVCVCLELMKFYIEPQFEEKRLSCTRLLIEVLVRYRLETPEGLTGLPDLCILVLKSEPSNPYALELLLRSQIERFLIVGLPFFISSSLIGPPVEFPVMVELLDELLDPETEERLDSLYKYSDTLGERSSKTASATVHLGRLILLAAATLRNPESDFCSDTWKSITERVDSIALNDCVGLANWHKRGYMDFHVCCLHALAAFKQHLFDRCEMVLKKILTECAVKMSTAAEDSRQLSVLSTVPLSQLTDFLTPRPMCSPFRCDLNSIRISYGGALRSPYDLIKEWALTVRMANAAASELSHVTSRLVAELLPMWLKPMSFVWPSVSQTLWMECCLSINRLDLALRVLLPLDVNEPTVDKVVEHALLVERSEIRLRICALWTAFIFILQNKRLESDKKPFVVDLIEAAGDLVPVVNQVKSTRDQYLLGRLFSCCGSVTPDTNIASVTSLAEQYTAGIQADETYYVNHLFLGKLLRQSGKVKAALEPLSRAHALMPSSPEAAYELSLALCQDYQLETALDTYTTVDQRLFTQQMWLNFGLIALRLGKTSKCVPALQKVIISDPKNPLYREILGEAYLLRGSYETAMRTLNHSIQIDPNRPVAQTLCGKAYRLLGDHHLARVHLELGVQCARQALGSKQIRKDLLIFALKELIEFKLVLGYSYIREGLRGRAIDEFESLLQYINEVFELSSLGHPTPVWAYHYLGSAFSLFAPVNDSELRLKVPVRFLSVLRFTEGQEFIDLDGGTMDLSAGFILAGIYFAGAFKRWSEIKTSPCPLPDATPTESHAVSRGCFLITLGLHCLSHATYLRKSRLSKSSSGLTLDTLLQLSESSLKQALNVLDTSAALDQRFLDAQDADEDISEVIKISRMDTTEEQRVRDRLSINGVLRSKAWYGLAMLHSVVGGDFDAQIDYCLCQALLASPTITEGGTSLALRLLHQGRSQFATSLLAHFQAADPDNFAVWLASAHLHALTEAPETRPITHAESDSSVQINHAVLQDLLQAACLEANVQVSLQLSANLLPLLVDSVCSAHNRRNLAASTHLQKSRAFLRLAVEVTTEALSRALAYEPQNARLWHHRGLFLQLAGLSKPAEYCFQNALRLLTHHGTVGEFQTDLPLIYSHCFLNSCIQTNPDWSVADLLLSLSGEYSPCVCASLAEAFAKGIIFLHHPSLSHQFDMAFKCLVDEPSRLASQGCSAALSSLNVFPHVGKWLLILSCLDRPDETSLRCSASLLTELLSTPSVTFSPLHPHLVQLLSSAGVSLMHLFSPQDTTLSNLSKVCRLRHQDYEDTVENPVESMHTGHVLYENGHLDASERAVWIMNDAMLSTYVSGSRVSSGLAYISRFVARRPDDPVRWNALAHWALERCRSMVEPPADQELREKKRLKSAKSKRFSFEWSVLFQAIATSLRLQSEIPMDALLSKVLAGCAQLWLSQRQVPDTKWANLLLTGLRRALALFPHTPDLRTQLLLYTAHLHQL